MHYRLYFLDRLGRIRHAIDLDCVDDAHAVETVEKHADGRAMELWQSARLVKAYAQPAVPE
jgi:hypothetical protein